MFSLVQGIVTLTWVDPKLRYVTLSKYSMHDYVLTSTILQGPSSSVLLTSEPNATPGITCREEMIDNVVSDPSEPQLCPKSKRTKVTSSDLVKEKQCVVDILTRARQAEPPFTAYSDPDLVMSKYTKFVGKISNNL